MKKIATCAAALSMGATMAMADMTNGEITVVVLTDMSSSYSDTSGRGSVAGAELAVEDFAREHPDIKVRVLNADHQNKADIGVLKAREMIDTQGADVFVDISNSAVSLAVQTIVRDADRAVIHVGSATAAIFGEACTPTGAMWLYDTDSLSEGLGRAIIAEGGDSWFFISADYAFGKAMEASMTRILGEMGGTVKGAVRHPINNTDYSSFVLQAQESGAKVVGFFNASGDTVNSLKAAGEFGLAQQGQKMAAPLFYIQSAKAVGPELAQGLQYMAGYYWDRDEPSRAFAERFSKKMGGGVPSEAHAGTYSATLHYLRAAAAAQSDSGKTVMAKMKEMPVDDFFAPGAMVRADGRLQNDMYLVEVKKPSEITGEWDILKVIRTMPAQDILMPLEKSKCPMVNN
ncbi:ABC transporter substrate-binding protein [Haematobacter genomosp. 1]|uniref:ABC transporter permease n=1 Tax=Haematobacter genomosp. 1 TaxID=366618 RepID=A0A212AB92_9RHOB|nr:ABC transporter substrate-binding protein [Haematobacter genomosp. 1]OWJ77874.1 ABC transporter permease [Haematobacter genomosp. 1]